MTAAETHEARLDALTQEADRRTADTIAGLLRGRDPSVDFGDGLSAVLAGVLVGALTAACAAAEVGTPVAVVVENLVDGLRSAAEEWAGSTDAPNLAVAAVAVLAEESADG